jgi:hypothetical protein
MHSIAFRILHGARNYIGLVIVSSGGGGGSSSKGGSLCLSAQRYAGNCEQEKQNCTNAAEKEILCIRIWHDRLNASIIFSFCSSSLSHHAPPQHLLADHHLHGHKARHPMRQYQLPQRHHHQVLSFHLQHKRSTPSLLAPILYLQISCAPYSCPSGWKSCSKRHGRLFRSRFVACIVA